MLRLHVRPHFGPHTKVADVSFADIDRLHRKITPPATCVGPTRWSATVAKMFSAGRALGQPGGQPGEGHRAKLRDVKRKRYMVGDELARLTAALAEHEDKQAANVIRVCLLSGCRVGEARQHALGRRRPRRGRLDEAGQHHQAADRPRRAAVRAAASAAVGHPRGAGRRPSEAAARRVRVPLRSRRRRRPPRHDQARLARTLQGRGHHRPAGARPAPQLRLAAREQRAQPAADRRAARPQQPEHDGSL